MGALLADEVLWQLAGDGTGKLWHGRRGRAAVLAVLRDSRNSWSRLQTKTVNAFAGGEQVLVEQVSTLVDKDGTQHVKPVAFVFLVADGRVAKISTYRNDGRVAADRRAGRPAPPSPIWKRPSTVPCPMAWSRSVG